MTKARSILETTLHLLIPSVPVIPLVLCFTLSLGACQCAIAPTPTATAKTEEEALLRVIRDLRDQYAIGTPPCCNTGGSGDHPLVADMITTIINHPLAQSFTLTQLETMFEEVTTRQVSLIAGGTNATLLSVSADDTSGSHHWPYDQLYVIDGNDCHYVGAGGLLRHYPWWIEDRWVILLRLKTDSSSGPTGWSVWHIGQKDGRWGKLVEHEFVPAPYEDGPFPIQFEDGYNTISVDLEYWAFDHPCQFTDEFTSNYAHYGWRATTTYQLVNEEYKLIDRVYSVEVYYKGTGEKVDVDWRDYCVDAPE